MSDFKPGFRLSNLDIGTLFLGCLGAYYYANYNLLISFIILFVVGHFFLFCNVVRMSRFPELIWAISFLSMTICSLVFQLFSPEAVFALSLLITFILIYFELRKPSYHGLFWKKFNPDLPEWFNNNSQS